MKVKLKKDWKEHKADAVAELDEGIAKTLVETGYAEEIGTTKTVEDALKASLDRLESGITEIVTKAVDAGAAQAKKKADGITITNVHENVLDDPKRGFKHAGDFVKAVLKAGLAPADTDPRLKAALGQQEADATAGGYLVPPEFAAAFIERRLEEPTSILGMCDRYMLRGNSVTINGLNDADRATAATRYGGVIAYWVAEAATITASTLSFRQINLRLSDLAAVVYATNDILEDAVLNMGEKITSVAGLALEDTVLEAILFGNGIGQPLGAFASPCLRSIAIETGQTLATGGVVSQNIWKMWAAMPGYLRNGAVWLINPDVEVQLAQLTYQKEVTGGYVPAYMPPGGISGRPYGTLQGRPVIVTEHCPALGTVGDIALGNFSQYALALKGNGVTSAVSIHIAFLTNQTAFRFVLRADGRPTWGTYVTPRKGTTYMSPFVAVAVRT